MIKISILLPMFLITNVLAQGDGPLKNNSKNDDKKSHPVFCVLLHTPGPKWTEDKSFQEQPGIINHIQYMREQLQNGMLIIGGPFLDDTGGMMICRTSDIEKAKLIAESDPAVISGLLSVKVKRWMVPMSSLDLTEKIE